MHPCLSIFGQTDFASLPVFEILPHIYDHLESRQNAVIVAPPGAGKTTAVPLALLQSGWRHSGKKIIVLEPRRLAARSAAYRMASIIGEEVGKTVGFTTRIESAISSQTRIEVITEGILTRRLMSTPLLEDIAGIIFDEIHERSLTSDFTLACCLDLQRILRPELRLLAMSATIDGAAFAKTMQAETITSMGRSFPVDIRYTPNDLSRLQDLPIFVAQTLFSLLEQGEEGDILAFLPGAGEIHRCKTLIDEHPYYGKILESLPLYGELPFKEQEKIFSPSSEKRRIILATSIAETSLTVPGIRIVIDGGFKRIPHYSQDTGLSPLHTQRISRAGADQRAGRAGRVMPGIAVRLWSAATQRSLIPQDVPEILNSDLSGFCLNCAHWEKEIGTPLKDLPFLNTPPSGAITAAESLLYSLAALDESSKITPFGQKMAILGTHPRLASMMLEANTAEEQLLAAYLAALLEERDPIRPTRSTHGHKAERPEADILQRLALLAHNDDHAQPSTPYYIDYPALHRIRHAARQFYNRMNLKTAPSLATILADHNQCTALCANLITAAFPDRVAQKRNEEGSFKLAGGGSARITRTDPLAKEKLLAVAVLHHFKTTEIQIAVPLSPQNLPPSLKAKTLVKTELMVDPTNGAVMGHQRIKLGTLTLQDRTIPLASDDIAPLLISYAQEHFSSCFTWTDATRQLQSRIELARTKAGKNDLPDLSDHALKSSIHTWLFPYITNMKRISELQSLDMKAILSSFLGYTHLHWLDTYLPSKISLNGHTIPIDYTKMVPVLAAKAQLFFGLAELPSLAKGKVALQAALLSPAGRTQAITTDLAHFWKNGWKDMRRDMKGRYPKHVWPEDPSHI